MSRILGTNTVIAMFAQETGEVYLTLIKISHPSLSVPLRVTSDAVNTVSNGNTFISIPFNITLPSDEEGSPPKSQISIDNVSKEVVDALRSINNPATLDISIVRAADPDVEEATFFGFQLFNVQGDALQLSAELQIEDITTQQFPSDIFSPARFPGLF